MFVMKMNLTKKAVSRGCGDVDARTLGRNVLARHCLVLRKVYAGLTRKAPLVISGCLVNSLKAMAPHY